MKKFMVFNCGYERKSNFWYKRKDYGKMNTKFKCETSWRMNFVYEFQIISMKISFCLREIIHKWGNCLTSYKNTKEIDKYFLYYFLLWYNFFKNWTDNSVKWATLNKEKLKRIQIPLPPLPTQQKIVEKLDEIFAKIDKNISLTKQNIANIEEENNAILEKIFKECEEGFEVEKIDKIFQIKSWNFLPKNAMNENGIYNVYWWNWITGKHSEKNLEWENIIIWRVGALCWNVRYLNEDIWLTDNAFYISKYLIPMNLRFLEIILKILNLWHTSNSSAQPVISYKTIKELKIPLPPLPKQQEIVTYLDNIFAKNSELKNFYEKNLKNLEELRQSILKQAFEDENFIK